MGFLSNAMSFMSDNPNSYGDFEEEPKEKKERKKASEATLQYFYHGESVPQPPAFGHAEEICNVFFSDEHKMIYVSQVNPEYSGRLMKHRDWYFVDYSDLVSVELSIDGSVVGKGGLGGAAVGAVAFGPVGAIAGAIIGRKNVGTCESMSVLITTQDMDAPIINRNIISTSTKKSSESYKNAKQLANRLCMRCSAAIGMGQALVAKEQATKTAPSSVADELLKFKSLLDCGAISQEEFDRQKQKLLG